LVSLFVETAAGPIPWLGSPADAPNQQIMPLAQRKAARATT